MNAISHIPPISANYTSQKRKRFFINTLGFALSAVICAAAWAEPGASAWNDEYDPGFGQSSADFVVAAGNTAYVAGAGPYTGSPSSNADIRVRAYDVASGTQLWENVWDPSGSHGDDTVNDLAVNHDRVYIAGQSANAMTVGSHSYVVRALDGATGQPLWEDQCGQANSTAGSIAVTARRVFVVGNCTNTTSAGIVRAYDASTGTVVWQVDDFAVPLAVTVSGNKVVVAGYNTFDPSTHVFVVRTYSIARGRFLWESRPDVPQGSFRQVRLIASDTVAYIAWSGVDSNGAREGLVTAYGSSKGRLHWASTTSDYVTGLALAKRKLFVAEGGTQALLSAYDESSGALLWRDQPGTAGALVSAAAVTTGGNQVFIAGEALSSTSSAPTFLVRAYTLNGTLLWQDDAPTAAPLGASAQSVAWSQGITIASGDIGRTTPPIPSTHWLVRAYSSTSQRAARKQ
jgi:hypothetical protein